MASPPNSPTIGGVSANPKSPHQKILRWSKKGEGGLSFFIKSKKNSFFGASPNDEDRAYTWCDPLCQFGMTPFVEMGSALVDSVTNFVEVVTHFVDSVTHFVDME